MSVINTPPHIRSLEALKTRAEDVSSRAVAMTNSLRAEYARAMLSEAFPDHTLAIFSRHWEDEEPELLQILSNKEGIEDFDRTEDPELDSLSGVQSDYLVEAQDEIRAIGSDDAILMHLDPGETEHEGWVEFQLQLHGEQKGSA